MEVRYDGFGRALRNSIRIETRSTDRIVTVQPLE
jgi:hypothetical protein